MDAAAFAAERRSARLDRRLEGLGAGRHRHIVEVSAKAAQSASFTLRVENCVERLARDRCGSLGVDVVERDADDPAAGNEARRCTDGTGPGSSLRRDRS